MSSVTKMERGREERGGREKQQSAPPSCQHFQGSEPIPPLAGTMPWAAKCHLQLPSPTSARSWRRGGGGRRFQRCPLFSIKCATFLPGFTHCERHPHTGLSVSPGQLLLTGHVPTDASEVHYLSRLAVGRRHSRPPSPCPFGVSHPLQGHSDSEGTPMSTLGRLRWREKCKLLESSALFRIHLIKSLLSCLLACFVWGCWGWGRKCWFGVLFFLRGC